MNEEKRGKHFENNKKVKVNPSKFSMITQIICFKANMQPEHPAFLSMHETIN